ncbi:hypothetical protein TNCV_3385931 [Trichonephila clavipes]|nr:hypothetical protein TNCV_3385931 [Trichonephila clavipes]
MTLFLSIPSSGRDSLVVKETESCHEFEPSTTEDEQSELLHINYVEYHGNSSAVQVRGNFVRKTRTMPRTRGTTVKVAQHETERTDIFFVLKDIAKISYIEQH